MPRSTGTSRSSGTTTSRSTAGAARTSRTSSTSSATGRTRPSSSSSGTTARTQLILDAAHAVVVRNERRKDKKLWTSNQGGRPIQRFEAYNEEEEAEWIARQIEGLTGGKGSLLTRRADDDEDGPFRARDIAVMYRMNAQSRAIEESFLRYGLRYQLVGGVRFYQRREVKDALAYLRILRSDTDVVSFERIINVPSRGIGDKSLEALRRWSAQTESPRGTRSRRARRAISRASRRASGRRCPTSRTSSVGSAGAVGLLRCRSSSTRCSSSRATARCSPTAPRRVRSAGRTSSSCGRSTRATPTSRRRTRSTGCSRRPRWSRTRTPTRATRTPSTLITLHAAKGLEFPVVFIAGLEEGLFPHNRALDDEQELEEERRLAYVGITRAKRRLYLSHAWRRATWGGGGKQDRTV